MSDNEDHSAQRHESTGAAAKADLTRTPRGGRTSNLADIAEAAGVAISTVSRALSGAPGVSEVTSRRIREVAETLSYRGRNIAVGPIQIHVITEIENFASVEGSFYGAMAEGMEYEADNIGGRMSIAAVDKSRDITQQLASLEGANLPTGFLLISIDDDALMQAVAALGPVVLVNSTDPLMRYDGVSPANLRGGYIATRHLLELGHRRIAHFTYPGRSTMRDRLNGYSRALSEFGVPFDPGLVFELKELSPEGGADAARAALEQGRFDATAVFAASDLVALGVINSLRNAGLSVPNDVSIVGFDNTRVATRHQPGLTTVNVDVREIGRLGVRRLVELMKNPELNPIDIIVGCKLMVRESTRPLT